MCHENDYSDGYYEGFYYDERDNTWYKDEDDDDFEDDYDDDYPDFSDK